MQDEEGNIKIFSIDHNMGKSDLFHHTDYKVNLVIQSWELIYEGVNPCDVMASVKNWESIQDVKRIAYKTLISECQERYNRD